MKIALIGNPNSGKTTLFNTLTGMNQKIGNWPGVTLERKSGIIKGTRHELYDLPGIYSLYPYTSEEKVSRDFLLNSNVDLIINVVDAGSIERGLYLTTQLIDFDVQVILVLNMVDTLESKGLSIDKKVLENKLGMKVCMISALKKQGIDELIMQIENVKNSKKYIFSKDIEDVIFELGDRIKFSKNKRFYALESLTNEDEKIFLKYSTYIAQKYGIKCYETLIMQRYQYISNICKEAIKKTKRKQSVSNMLDKILLNKFLAFPIFGFIMFAIYFLSVGTIGNIASEAISICVENTCKFFENFLFSIGVSKWLISLICNAVISGVGSVISFLPQLTILFFGISILESTGYMSRIAFLLDKVFKKVRVKREKFNSIYYWEWM